MIVAIENVKSASLSPWQRLWLLPSARLRASIPARHEVFRPAVGGSRPPDRRSVLPLDPGLHERLRRGGDALDGADFAQQFSHHRLRHSRVSKHHRQYAPRPLVPRHRHRWAQPAGDACALHFPPARAGLHRAAVAGKSCSSSRSARSTARSSRFTSWRRTLG